MICLWSFIINIFGSRYVGILYSKYIDMEGMQNSRIRRREAPIKSYYNSLFIIFNFDQCLKLRRDSLVDSIVAILPRLEPICFYGRYEHCDLRQVSFECLDRCVRLTASYASYYQYNIMIICQQIRHQSIEIGNIQCMIQEAVLIQIGYIPAPALQWAAYSNPK